MNNKITLTIGIPAFNEEANIGFLIKSLLSQTNSTYSLKSIVVSSDGSTDNTINILKTFKSKKIIIIDNKIRVGQALAQNKIISLADSDVLVLLNADVQINDNNFIDKLIKPILVDNIDLTSCATAFVKNVNFFSKVLMTSTKIRENIASKLNFGDNLLNCHGRARGFSKKLYKKIIFKNSVNEDAYSYLFTKVNGFKFKYVDKCKIYYKLPTNYQDHFKQSNRFIKKHEDLAKVFGMTYVQNAYKIPIFIGVSSVLKVFIFEPFLTVMYLFVLVAVRIQSVFYSPSNTWSISKSSKSFT